MPTRPQVEVRAVKDRSDAAEGGSAGGTGLGTFTINKGEAIGVLTDVLRSRREELIVMLMLLAMLLVLSSAMIYYAEHEAQPDAFGSMPAALWWSVITLTTIGYGDVYPVTAAGRVIGGLIAVAGIGIVALPTAIVATGFAEEIRKRKGKAAACPHCGKTP